MPHCDVSLMGASHAAAHVGTRGPRESLIPMPCERVLVPRRGQEGQPTCQTRGTTTITLACVTGRKVAHVMRAHSAGGVASQVPTNRSSATEASMTGDVAGSE